MIKLYCQWLYNRDYKRGYKEAEKDLKEYDYSTCLRWWSNGILMGVSHFSTAKNNGYGDYLYKYSQNLIAR